MTGLSPEFCSTRSPSTSASSPSSSLIVEHDHRMILPQGTDSYGIPLQPPSPVIQAAISNSEFTWKFASSSLIVEHDHRVILPQGTDSYGILLQPPSPAIQAAISNSEFTWKFDEDAVVVAGTLEGLVQFLVITIGERPYR